MHATCAMHGPLWAPPGPENPSLVSLLSDQTVAKPRLGFFFGPLNWFWAALGAKLRLASWWQAHGSSGRACCAVVGAEVVGKCSVRSTRKALASMAPKAGKRAASWWQAHWFLWQAWFSVLVFLRKGWQAIGPSNPYIILRSLRRRTLTEQPGRTELCPIPRHCQKRLLDFYIGPLDSRLLL